MPETVSYTHLDVYKRQVQDKSENGMAAVLNMYAPEFVDSKDTVVVIDEIQESPVIYSRIRELAREFSCDFIVTGSYLGKTREKEFFLSAGDTELSLIHIEMCIRDSN